MKTQVVILHGTLGSPSINWFPWLKNELERIGANVSVPKFPTPEGQTINNWIDILDQNVQEYDNNLILVGHSSAPLVICVKLQELKTPIKACFFIAPFVGKIGNKEYDQYNSEFISFDFNWNKIKAKSKFYIYRSNNDPYVPEESGKVLAEKLEVKETIIPNGGHLNAESGFVQFPKLLEDIKKVIQEES
jgi:predicted alpha/beta hydrolase family esterase